MIRVHPTATDRPLCDFPDATRWERVDGDGGLILLDEADEPRVIAEFARGEWALVHVEDQETA